MRLMETGMNLIWLAPAGLLPRCLPNSLLAPTQLHNTVSHPYTGPVALVAQCP